MLLHLPRSGALILALSVTLAACGDDSGAGGAGTTSSGGDGGVAGDGGAAATTTTTTSAGDGGAATTGATSSSASSGQGSGGDTTAGTGGAGSGGDGSGGAQTFSMTDDLRGSTVGLMTGGSLGEDGWTVEGVADRIIWELPRLVSGSFEFTVTGITLDNLPYREHDICALYAGGY
jgi:hypothetical protein